jgi:hypothetical protein
MFIFHNFFIPKPPFFFDLQTFCHLPRWYFFFKLPPLLEEFSPSLI